MIAVKTARALAAKRGNPKEVEELLNGLAVHPADEATH
jgi:hypothetical protein